MKQKPPMLWALHMLRHRLAGLVFLMISETAGSILSVMYALGFKEVINSAVKGDLPAFRAACFAQAAIISGHILAMFFSRHLRDLLTAEMDRDWKKKLFHVLLHGQYKDVAVYHTGELINRLNNDVRILDDGLLNVLPGFVSMIVKVVSIMVVMFAWVPALAAVLTVLGLLMVVGTGLVRKRIGNLHKRVSESEGKVGGFLQEALEKLFVVQAMDISEEMERRSGLLLKERFRLQKKRKNVFLAANTLIGFLTNAGRFGALLWGAVGIIQGTFSYGELTAILQLVNQLQSPLVSASGILTKYTAMSAAAERLMELSSLSQEQDSEDLNVEQTYLQMTELRGENVTFSYDQDPVIVESTFSIPKGSFTVITGSSGNGKSTLLKLVLGIYEPEQGSVSVCTEENRITLGRHTRSLFAYVPQGNLLFSGTLRENLLLTNRDASDTQIQEAVYVSAVDQFLDQLPDGLDTVLGENGAGLSEGQAQRVAIARAILTGAPILLLDEATSALDAETELTVLGRIEALKGRTCIAVTHRPAALGMADWQLSVLDKKIVSAPVICADE